MSQRKHKPAQPVAAQPKQPEPPQSARELRMAEVERKLKAFEEASAFFADMSSRSLYLLLTFRKIIDNDRGCTTPVEEFISHLVWLWGKEDENGQGLTVEDIESEVRQLREADLSGEIKNAHWMAARYPLPKTNTAEAAEPASN